MHTMTCTSKTDETSQKGPCSVAEHPTTAEIVAECFRIVAERPPFVAAEAVQALYRRMGSWAGIAKSIGDYLSETGYDRIKGNRIPSRTDWWKTAHGQGSTSTEKALRAYLGLMPRRVRTVDRMRTADLGWYMRACQHHEES